MASRVRGQGESSGDASTAVDSATAESATRLGEAIRRQRRALGFKLVDLAQRSGLSQAFLSQVERGQANPSMRSLNAIAAALDTNAPALMALPGLSSVSYLRRDSADVTVRNSTGTVRSLVRGDRMLLGLEFNGGPREFEDYYLHGGDEFMYLVRGRLEVDLDGTIHELVPGDTLYYSGEVPHRWRSVGDEEVCLVVMQPNPGLGQHPFHG